MQLTLVRIPRFLSVLLLCTSLSMAAATGGQATTKAAQATPPPENPSPTTHKTDSTTVEVGEIGGVPYRIDIPDKWNHRLVVYYHGYSHSPLHYKADAPEVTKLKPIIARGYAVIQSAYSQIGWALDSGYNDTEKLRKYFVKKHGQPTESYVMGESMGGALTVMTIERNAKPYIGGLNLCGAVGSSLTHVERRFALRAAFDFYFPHMLPPIDHVPADFEETEPLRQKVLAALNAKPNAALAMRNLIDLDTNIEVARMMVYFTYVIGDIQKKAGGNPLENRNTIYTGTSNDPKTDYALNDGVVRYTADPRARAYLLRFYEPTGKVTRPVLALHTTYDPLVPANLLSNYHQMVEKAGFDRNYVQQYVHREGHCTMTPDEVAKSFDELVVWTHGGKAPVSGLLR